ncbi:MAG: glycosyltransferase [Lachnospiraceae bacterium]|nr:glycosyltransferase [Lachnospiraceae bacterium]
MSLTGNIKRTVGYFKKNGIKDTFYAVAERLDQKRKYKYRYEAPTEAELAEQRAYVFREPVLISVVVPAYETKDVFMQDLILSLEDQTYRNFELVIADASKTDAVKNIVEDFSSQYDFIRYLRLESNDGISENTNRGIDAATGKYIGLLDHDDVLTPDALFHVMCAIEDSDVLPDLIYSDEDKADGFLDRFFDPYRKNDFNRDLLFTNNYICHFSVFRAEVIKGSKLRKEYDGAQDYDLILRICAGAKGPEYIKHIPRVLYHWRCHTSSTSDNPESKMYAYEAGRRAAEAAVRELTGKQVEVKMTKHLGFYRTEYGDGIFDLRPDIGAVGGPLFRAGRVSGGAMDKEGHVMFEGLPKGFSGLIHIASLQQDVEAADIRNIRIRDDLMPLFREVTGEDSPDSKALDTLNDKDAVAESLKFCNKLREQGIVIMYDPDLTKNRG